MRMTMVAFWYTYLITIGIYNNIEFWSETIGFQFDAFDSKRNIIGIGFVENTNSNLSSRRLSGYFCMILSVRDGGHPMASA